MGAIAAVFDSMMMLNLRTKACGLQQETSVSTLSGGKDRHRIALVPKAI